MKRWHEDGGLLNTIKSILDIGIRILKIVKELLEIFS